MRNTIATFSIAVFLSTVPVGAFGAQVASCDDLAGVVAVDPSTGASVDVAAFCKLDNRAVAPITDSEAKSSVAVLKSALKVQKVGGAAGLTMSPNAVNTQVTAVNAFSIAQTLDGIRKFVVKLGSKNATAGSMSSAIRGLEMANATVHPSSTPLPAPSASPSPSAAELDGNLAARFADFGCYVMHNGDSTSCPSPSASPWASPAPLTSLSPTTPAAVKIPAHAGASDAQFEIQPDYSVVASSGNLTLAADYSTSVVLPSQLRFIGPSPILVGTLHSIVTVPKAGLISMQAKFTPSNTTSGIFDDGINVGMLSLSGTNLSTIGSNLSQYQDIQFCSGERSIPVSFLSLKASISCRARYGISVIADTQSTLGYAVFGPSVDVAITGDVIADAIFISGTLSADVHLVTADARFGLMYGFIGDKQSPLLLFNPIETYDVAFGQSSFTFTVGTSWGKKYDVPIASVPGFRIPPPPDAPWYSVHLPS